MVLASVWTAVSFVIGLIISTIVIFIVTKLFGEKEGIKTAFIAAIIGAVIYTLSYFVLGHGILAAAVGGIAWLLSLKWLYNMGWIKSIIVAVIIWIFAAIVSVFLLPTSPGPL
ncbi:MAG TPA: hypothetical protein VE089_00225 [Nitrososphaeraceae archaeon]|jgi:hypothetical protein|nr:hypothetical protein [Nitrososphaeraceae archaeon]